MSSRKERGIPAFRSEEEEAVFWATHDTADWWELTKEVPSGEFEFACLQRARRKRPRRPIKKAECQKEGSHGGD